MNRWGARAINKIHFFNLDRFYAQGESDTLEDPTTAT